MNFVEEGAYHSMHQLVDDCIENVWNSEAEMIEYFATKAQPHTKSAAARRGAERALCEIFRYEAWIFGRKAIDQIWT